MSDDLVEREFYEAAKHNRLSPMQEFLSDGIDINWTNAHERGRTAVHAAAAGDATACLRVLVDEGASLELRDENEKTPLHLAVEVLAKRVPAGDGAQGEQEPDPAASLTVLVDALLREASSRGHEVQRLQKQLDETEARLADAEAELDDLGIAPDETVKGKKAGGKKGKKGRRGAPAAASTGGEPPKAIMAQKRLGILQRLEESIAVAFERMTPVVMRHLRQLDDPPGPVYRLADVMCYIAKVPPPRTWPELQEILGHSSFRKVLGTADPTSYSESELHLIRNGTARLPFLLNQHKLISQVYVCLDWVLAFEKATTFCLQHPVTRPPPAEEDA